MWSKIQLGDIGTWIASVGTVAAVVLALWQTRRTSQKDRDREEKEQAAQVSSWLIGEGRICGVALRNTSATPVYQAILTLVAYQGAGPRNGTESQFRRYLGIIPPGQTYTTIEGAGGAMYIRLGVEMAFTDSRGINWVREVRGKLYKIGKQTVDYYSAPPPIDWVLPEIEPPKNIKIDPTTWGPPAVTIDPKSMPALNRLLGK
jgi:hypothetical protein